MLIKALLAEVLAGGCPELLDQGLAGSWSLALQLTGSKQQGAATGGNDQPNARLDG